MNESRIQTPKTLDPTFHGATVKQPKPAKPTPVTPTKDVSPLGLYQPAHEALKTWQPKGTPQQLLAHLGKHQGAMAHAEIAGLHSFLEGKPSVTREEVAKHLGEGKHLGEAIQGESPHWSEKGFRVNEESPGNFTIHDDNDGSVNRNFPAREHAEETAQRWANGYADKDDRTRPHFDAYQLPGPKENYRELHVTAPDGTKKPFEPLNPDDYFGEILTRTSNGDYRVMVRDKDGRAMDTVHVVDGDPNKAARNWAREQSARRYRESEKSGSWKDGHEQFSHVKNPVVRIRHNDRIDSEGNKVFHVEEFQGPSDSNQAKMPEHLRDRIYEIGVKRALAKAVEGGYDKLTWTTGEQQADRYKLSNHADTLILQPLPEGKVYLHALKNGQPVTTKQFEDSKLGAAIGDDVAEKLRAALVGRAHGLKGQVLEGQDLNIGGHGLKSVYDRMVPSLVSKLVKKAGGRVERAEIPSEPHYRVGSIVPGQFVILQPGAFRQIPDTPSFPSQQAAEEWAENNTPPHTVHSLRITPEIRALVKQGFSQYERDGEPERYDRRAEELIERLIHLAEPA